VITSRLPRRLAGVAFLCGAGAWIWFLTQGLVLSHYDAKAHLVVARRVIDNITPGWQQVGAVWLPLPHLIHLLPTQKLSYALRPSSASPAVGYLALHNEQQKAVMDAALTHGV